MSWTSARSAARAASAPQLSRANVIFLKQLLFTAALPCGRHYFSPHKMAAKNHWLLVSWHCALMHTYPRSAGQKRSDFHLTTYIPQVANNGRYLFIISAFSWNNTNNVTDTGILLQLWVSRLRADHQARPAFIHWKSWLYTVVSSLFHTGKTQNFLSPQFEKEKKVK